MRLGRTKWITASLIYGLLSGGLAQAEPIRIASYNTELSRRGPGLLLRDIQSGKDEQVQAVVGIIAHISPDIVLLNGFDYDFGNAALNAFANLLSDHTTPYPYRFALRPNTGMDTGLDMDGDGRTGGAGDAQGLAAKAAWPSCHVCRSMMLASKISQTCAGWIFHKHYCHSWMANPSPHQRLKPCSVCLRQGIGWCPSRSRMP